jgi:hypothetical protein
MTIRSKTEYLQYIETILPDNSSRLISPADIRVAFRDLSDSVGRFLEDTSIVATNFSTNEERTTRGGDSSLSNIGLEGRTSVDNTAYGFESLTINYNGARNTAIGSRTLACNSFGSDNVALGFNALGSNTTGSGNVSIGSYSLVKNTRGNHNIAIGHGAAYYVKNNSNQKFYLGTYPNASGDCDTDINDSGRPPLLYGDLSTRQLGIGTDILVSTNVGLAVSGDVVPASGQVFSIGSGDYRFDGYFRNVYVDGDIDVPLAWRFDLSDQFGTSGTIDKDDQVYISGVSGVETFYDHDTRNMTISAQPVSGWASGNFSDITNTFIEISGKGGQLLTVSGLVDSVSGWARSYSDNYAHVSGYLVSGWADTTIKDYAYKSGVLVSGWADNNFAAISGFGGILTSISGKADGIVYLSSGWNKNYTEDYVDAKILAANSFAFWEIEGQFGGSGQIEHADTLVISGVSGIETHMNIDEDGTDTFYNLSVSAAPISGWTSGVFTEISGVDGIIDTRVAASAALISGFAYDIAVDKASDATAYTVNVSGWTDFQIDKYAFISGYQVSGWAFSDLLQISGWEPGRTIYDVSGHLQTSISDAVLEAGSYTFWEIEGQYGGSGQIHHSDTLSISGCSGIETRIQIGENLTENFYRLDISAAPISGYMEHRFSQSSGIITSLSGIDGIVSGAINASISDALEVASAEASSLDSSLKSDLTREEFTPIKQSIKDYAYNSGVLVSGWASSNFDAISGINGLLNTVSGKDDGLIYLVSGWNEKYTLDQIGKLSYPDGQDQYVNWFAEATTGPAQAVGASRYAKFIGKDGITTNIYNLDGKTQIDFSALAITDDLTEISGVGGLIDQKIDEAGADGTLFVFNVSDRFESTSQIGGNDTVMFSGASGIVAYVQEESDSRSRVIISAEDIRTDLTSLQDRVDCLVNVNCPGANSDSIQAVSGWAYSNFNTLSGVDPTIYGKSGLIWSISGQLTQTIKDKILDANAYDNWTISDADGPALEVRNGDAITFDSINGITVSRTAGTITVDAEPMSGVIFGELLAISGVGGFIDQKLSSTDLGLLGQAKNYTNNQILAVTGDGRWIDRKLNPISGIDGTISGAYDYTYLASGWNENYTYLSSGWSADQTYQISGVDGLLPSVSGWAEFTMDKYAYESGVLVSGWASGNFNTIYDDLAEISGVGGLIDQMDQNFYYGDSGIKLTEGNIFVTHGSGHFNKVITTKIDDASDPSGQIVADTGVSLPSYHDIVNASGYLITPRYNKLTTLKSSLPASPANSGAIVFANEYPYQSHADKWSRPTIIEGFMRDQLLPPNSYSTPTSGRMYVRDDNFLSSYEVYVTNRDFYLGISGTMMCVAMLVNGEYRPVYASPSGCGIREEV